ncbi:MAG: DUF4065 domain-containing protein [Nitrospirae bacterium]|nr:DUF4065 domain-containing protein [Nitrospirota bacterium]
MKKYGRPLIGDIYRKDELGPVAKHAESIINYIAHGINSKDFSGIEKEAGIVKEAVDIKVKANRRLEFNPRVEFERKYFSKSDIEILSEVSREFAKDNSKIISDKSHNEQGWLNTRHKDIIDWMYAFPEEDRAEIKQYLDHSNNLISSFNKMIDSCQ